MKMNLGSGTISSYGSYSNNCTKNQFPYRIPVNTLQDVQLYIDIGGIKPDAAQYQLIHTCGALGGTIESLATPDYIIGQSVDNYWYAVFKNFSNPSNVPTCFVIAITLTITGVDYIYFSDEFCREDCRPLIEIKGCYGNLDSAISFDEQDIYFGVHAGEDTALGDETIKYEHKVLLRGVELSLSAFKKTFKQGRTRNFRTESDKIYTCTAEPIPEWYMDEISTVYDRGEVYIDSVKWLVDGVGFEKVEDCKRIWKPTATLKKSHYQSFSCEVDPCAALSPTCCDPSGLTAEVEFEESGSEAAVCCDPEIINAEVLEESGAPCTPVIDDSYDEVNADGEQNQSADFNQKIGQSFLSQGGTLDSAEIYVRKAGTPTGDVFAIVYAHSGTYGTSSVPTGAALATSDPLDLSSVGGIAELYPFAFSGANRITLLPGTHYVLSIEYAGGGGGDELNIQVDTTAPSHGGNKSVWNGSWVATPGEEFCFYVYTCD